MTVMLLVDLSASQRFGSVARPKLETAAEVAALLAFSAIKNNDRVGLILFTDRVEKFVPPKKGKGHVLHVVTEILEAKPEHTGTNLRRGAQPARQHQPAQGGGVPGQRLPRRRLRARAARRQQAARSDPDSDRRSARGGAARRGPRTVRGSGVGPCLEVDTSDPRVRDAYKLRVAKERARREQTFKKLKLDSVSIRTDRPYAEPIADLFRLRQKRMRGLG